MIKILDELIRNMEYDDILLYFIISSNDMFFSIEITILDNSNKGIYSQLMFSINENKLDIELFFKYPYENTKNIFHKIDYDNMTEDDNIILKKISIIKEIIENDMKYLFDSRYFDMIRK